MTQDAKVVETLTREEFRELDRLHLNRNVGGGQRVIAESEYRFYVALVRHYRALCDMALRTEKAEREAERWNKSYARWVVAFVRAGIPAFDTLDTALERLIAKHADELSEARRKALEDAAKVCDELSQHGDPSAAHGCVHCAAAIRAMQEPAQGCSLAPGKLET